MNIIENKKRLNFFKLLIEYDGTNYHGWQIQPIDSSIQNEIQKILTIITKQPITIIGSGRTDAGVHAVGQVAHFECITSIPPEKFQDALNKMLPNDIVIRDCAYTHTDFHARYSARGKTYNYRILNSKIPIAINRDYFWHVIKTLDIDSMQKAADFLIGQKDFKAFEGAGSPRKSTVRKIFTAQLRRDDSIITFKITGSGFLKFMVRNIVGTLVDVGTGKLTPDEFNRILLSADRNNAGMTAPPQGLCLKHVEY